MDIKQQTTLAKKFTQDLAEFIVNANNKKLNKDDAGCAVSSIDIHYSIDSTTVIVKFDSFNGPVNSFVCHAHL